MLQPSLRDPVAVPVSHRLPESLLFPARSTEYLPRRYRKRSAPSRAQWSPGVENTQNCDVWRVRSNPMPSAQPRQAYAQSKRDSLPNLARRLMRSYHSAPLLVRSLRPGSRGKRRSLRDATRIPLDSTDRRRPAYRCLRYEAERFPSARSEQHASRIDVRSRNRQNRRACMIKPDGLQSLARRHLAPAPASKLVWQFGLQRTACRLSAYGVTDLSEPRKGGADDQGSDTRARRARDKFVLRVLPFLAWPLDISPPA
jgi:hypothetical protein